MRQGVGNRLLMALRGQDYDALKPHIEDVDLPLAKIICETGEAIEFAYFPHDCVISVVAVMEDGRTPEMTTISPEGAVGLIAMLGSRRAVGRYVVQLPGRASRMRLDALITLMEERSSLRAVMLQALQRLLVQTLHTVACNAIHPVEARCARWILMTHDRLGGGLLPLTHEFLAAMLGVQRPTVSIVTRTLQTAGLIKQGRGAITVIDALGLQEAACECYVHIRANFQRGASSRT